MTSRSSRVMIYLVSGFLALGGSAVVLPVGLRSAHHVSPAAALASLILAIAGFVCFVLALAAFIGRPVSSR